MPKLPSIPASKVILTLRKSGFELHRIVGSHHVLVKGDQTVVVPVHGNENLPKGTLLGILRQAGIGREEFIKLTRPKSKQ